MADEPSRIAREAKGLQQGLKELLKTKEPWDREVEFQRKNLRRQYLILLLVHPYSNASKDVQTHLWMQTSHAFITAYKNRIAALDKTLQSNARQPQRNGGHGPVEYRKILQRFRQFLAEEEKFWTQLLVRFRRTFALDEAEPALITLGIVPAPGSTLAAQGDADAPHEGERNPFAFLDEDGGSAAPPTDTQRATHLSNFSKALVCLGDLARYKEQYNEGGGRPKAGHEEGPPAAPPKRGGRGRRGAPDESRTRNYERAQQRYEQARLLVPSEGNALHQLAILAAYQKDAFSALVHYYRAMCVRLPYETAAENMGTVLKKALQHWKASGKTAEQPALAAFKDRVVVLHAMWNIGNEHDSNDSVQHAQDVLDDFRTLVSERNMPTDVILKVVALAEGALWKKRMVRDRNQRSSKAAGVTDAAVMAQHNLDLYRTMLDIGVTELAEAHVTGPSEDDLAQGITATFRRTLPALRVAGKWLRANSKTLADMEPTRTNDPASSQDLRSSAFWAAYARFMDSLAQAFPIKSLPSMEVPLEEDTDLAGFLPLKKLMFGESSSRHKHDRSNSQSAVREDHPNVEQLMRIGDILADAREVARSEHCPVVQSSSRFMLRGNRPPSESPKVDRREPVPAGNPLPLPQHRQEEFDEDARTETTDPVGDAFRQALGDVDSDTDDDEIVWDPRAPLSEVAPVYQVLPPAVPPPQPFAPKPPLWTERVDSPVLSSPPRQPPIGTPRSAPKPLQTPVTAEDLVNSIMGTSMGMSPRAALSPRSPLTRELMPPQTLGQNSPRMAIQTGWPRPLDNTPTTSSARGMPQGLGLGLGSPRFPDVGPGHPQPSRLHHHAPSWSQSSVSPLTQSQLPGALPSPPYPHSASVPVHQRVSSLSGFPPQWPASSPGLGGFSQHAPHGSMGLGLSPSNVGFADPAIMSSSMGARNSSADLRSQYRHDPAAMSSQSPIGVPYYPPSVWGQVG